MSEVQRLDACPLLSCTPLERGAVSCFGRNGTQRACLLVEDAPLLRWYGVDAWAGPGNWLQAEAAMLKADRQSV